MLFIFMSGIFQDKTMTRNFRVLLDFRQINLLQIVQFHMEHKN